MKTAIDYLNTEFKALTRMDIGALPPINTIDEAIKAIDILMKFNIDEALIIEVAKNCATDLRDRAFLMYA